MQVSDYIALAALAISVFTFYYTSLRKNQSLFLVRIDSTTRMLYPEFVIINGGNTDVLITSVLCVFYDLDGRGWESPDDQDFLLGEKSGSIPAGKSRHFKIYFPTKFSDDFVMSGEYIKNGSFEYYVRDMAVIVDWVDSKANEHRAEAKILEFGFDINGEIRTSGALAKWHNLYKNRSGEMWSGPAF